MIDLHINKTQVVVIDSGVSNMFPRGYFRYKYDSPNLFLIPIEPKSKFKYSGWISSFSVNGVVLEESNYQVLLKNLNKVDASGAESPFVGQYTSLDELELTHPVGESGQYAIVDPGPGQDAVKYIWDITDNKWVLVGKSGDETPETIKQKYESNANTNAFTDADKQKLDGINAGDFVKLNSDVKQIINSDIELEAGKGFSLRNSSRESRNGIYISVIKRITDINIGDNLRNTTIYFDTSKPIIYNKRTPESYIWINGNECHFGINTMANEMLSKIGGSYLFIYYQGWKMTSVTYPNDKDYIVTSFQGDVKNAIDPTSEFQLSKDTIVGDSVSELRIGDIREKTVIYTKEDHIFAETPNGRKELAYVGDGPDLSNYLPLTGGTLTGSLNIGSLSSLQMGGLTALSYDTQSGSNLYMGGGFSNINIYPSGDTTNFAYYKGKELVGDIDNTNFGLVVPTEVTDNYVTGYIPLTDGHILIKQGAYLSIIENGVVSKMTGPVGTVNMALLIKETNEIYLATAQGICSVNLRTKSFEQISEYGTKSWKILFYHPDGNLYGITQLDYYRIDPVARTYVKVASMSSNAVNGTIVSKSGNFYIVGYTLMDFDGTRVKAIAKPDSVTGVLNGVKMALDGKIWCTSMQGILAFDEATETLSIGANSSGAYLGIVKDLDGSLYFYGAANIGVKKLDIKTNQLNTITSAYRFITGYLRKNGDLLFGGVDGLFCIYYGSPDIVKLTSDRCSVIVEDDSGNLFLGYSGSPGIFKIDESVYGRIKGEWFKLNGIYNPLTRCKVGNIGDNPKYVKAVDDLNNEFLLPYEPVKSSGGENVHYSTEEHPTGRKWIDGNMIYERTTNFGPLGQGTFTSPAPANIDKCIDINAILDAGSAWSFKPRHDLFIADIVNDVIQIQKFDGNAINCYVTLLYTKKS